jgi:hypothetical protein
MPEHLVLPSDTNAGTQCLTSEFWRPPSWPYRLVTSTAAELC